MVQERRDTTKPQASHQVFGIEFSVWLTENRMALPRDLTEGCLDLDAAAEADLLLNLWHSLPAPVVRRFRLTALVDTDPGLLQIWMTTGKLNVAPHDVYFTVAFQAALVCGFFQVMELAEREASSKSARVVSRADAFAEYVETLNTFFVPTTMGRYPRRKCLK